MEPKFQTSFIPKSPITSSTSSSYKPESSSSFSIIGTISTLFFVIALLSSGGLFGYHAYMDREIQKAQTDLSLARNAFQSDDNEKIILVSNQLKLIKSLLNSHTTVSPVFALLEKQTLPTVRLTSFVFSHSSKGEVMILIEGEAQSYTSLAQQTKIFGEAGYLRKLEVTDIGLSDTGTVRTKMKAFINADALLYTKKVQAVSVIYNP
ncbi:MAG: hypothetical protein RL292_440 [Candidatus Parcubacteria bacterium]